MQRCLRTATTVKSRTRRRDNLCTNPKQELRLHFKSLLEAYKLSFGSFLSTSWKGNRDSRKRQPVCFLYFTKAVVYTNKKDSLQFQWCLTVHLYDHNLSYWLFKVVSAVIMRKKSFALVTICINEIWLQSSDEIWESWKWEA